MFDRINWETCLDTGIQTVQCFIGAYISNYVASHRPDQPSFSEVAKATTLLMGATTFLGIYLGTSLKKKLYPNTDDSYNFVNGAIFTYGPAIAQLTLNTNYIELATFVSMANIAGKALTFTESAEIKNNTPNQLLQLERSKNQSTTLTFKKRLSAIHYEGDIPEEFLDRIEDEIMDDPHILNTGHSFDLASIIELLKTGNGKCPIMREPITSCVRNVELKRSIERFVSQLEAAHKQKLSSSDAKSLKREGLFKTAPTKRDESASMSVLDHKKSPQKTRKML